MSEAATRHLSKELLASMRESWSKPDSHKGMTWDFDGVAYSPEHWMSYNHEMREGLSMFGCKTFDELVVRLAKKKNRKPHVVDLMGGAYFLDKPENAQTLVGIRIHDKDADFYEVSKKSNSSRSQLFRTVMDATNRHIIEADVLANSGWQKIRQAKVPSADLLVCRPVGPFDVRNAAVSRFDDPHTYAGLYTALFQRMLHLVDKNNGIIFTEIPDIYPEKDVRAFLQQADKKNISQSALFTVPDEDYQWGGVKRRYAVVQFGNIGGTLQR